MELRGCTLEFRWGDQDVTNLGGKKVFIGQPLRQVPDGLWKQFLRLHDATEEQVRRFALRYGPLTPNLRPGETEEISYWRHFSRLGHAIIRGHQAIAAGQHGEEGDWSVLSEFLNVPFDSLIPRERRRQDPLEKAAAVKFTTIPRALNKWFAQAGPCTLVDASPNGYGILIAPRSNTLLGAIVTQIANQVTGPTTVVACSNCGRVYEPSRRPRRGERHYCRECRRNGVPGRDAAREFRRRGEAIG